MDYPVALSPGRNWRITALVAAGIAALELVILLVVVLAAFGRPFAADRKAEAVKAATKAQAAATKTTADHHKKNAPAVAKLARNRTSVVVLNGNGISGAADQASGVIRSLHYVVAGTGNAPRLDFARTLVMYRPGFKGEAIRLAHDVRIKRVVPLDGMRPSDLMGAQVALILGRN
ncbi:MAG TPA: LytR C-terminal domain-containing protein [Gaiellaceae bacterium]